MTARFPLRSTLLVALLAAAGGASAQSAGPGVLDTIMSDPDWIGNGVERAWWSWDGTQALYQRKRDGATIRDTWSVPAAGGAPARVVDTARAGLDAADPAFDASHARMAFARNGDLFVRDLRSGALTQLTRTDAEGRVVQNIDGVVSRAAER